MTANNSMQMTKDLQNGKIFVTREFDAPLGDVWSAWTENDLLDQWWAPRPWMARTKSMNFKEGGSWLYAMMGPDGEKHWNLIQFISIQHHRSIRDTSFFCDENGNIDSGMPNLNWKIDFIATQAGTKVEMEISCDREADIKKVIEMGFEEGFTSALTNLDELLAK